MCHVPGSCRPRPGRREEQLGRAECQEQQDPERYRGWRGGGRSALLALWGVAWGGGPFEYFNMFLSRMVDVGVAGMVQ